MTIKERIESGEFNNKLPYPKRDSRTCGVDSPAQRALYESAVEAYRREERRLVALFREELAREHALLFHSKEELVWQKAWDHGHANGLSEVAYWYEEFAELVEVVRV